MDLPWAEYERLAVSAIAQYQTFDEYLREVLTRALGDIAVEEGFNGE